MGCPSLGVVSYIFLDPARIVSGVLVPITSRYTIDLYLCVSSVWYSPVAVYLFQPTHT